MPFGKHKGKLLEDVPTDYLAWVLDNCSELRPTLRQAIEQVLFGEDPEDAYARGYRDGLASGRQTTPVAPSGNLRSTIQQWYRRTSVRHHPDHGGDVRVMAVVNDLRDELLSLFRNP